MLLYDGLAIQAGVNTDSHMIKGTYVHSVKDSTTSPHQYQYTCSTWCNNGPGYIIHMLNMFTYSYLHVHSLYPYLCILIPILNHTLIPILNHTLILNIHTELYPHTHTESYPMPILNHILMPIPTCSDCTRRRAPIWMSTRRYQHLLEFHSPWGSHKGRTLTTEMFQLGRKNKNNEDV